MPKNMANEQAIFWLRSMSRDKDCFNSINAENALTLIMKLQKQIFNLGRNLSSVKKQRDEAWNAMKNAMHGLDLNDTGNDPEESENLYDLL